MAVRVIVAIGSVFVLLQVCQLNQATKKCQLNQATKNIYSTEHKVDQFLLQDFMDSNKEVLSSKDAQWISEYISWHNDQRKKFPDLELLTHNPNTNATVGAEAPPPVLITYFDTKTEGISGRLWGLKRLLSKAAFHRRLLLLKFYHPMELETFLRPTFFNWTMPIGNTTNTMTQSQLESTYPRFKKKKVGSGDIKTNPIVIERTNNYDNKRDKYLAEDVPLKIVWELFFEPSPLLQKTLDQTYQQLGISPGNYDAIHSRILHPAHFNRIAHQRAKYGAIDEKGLTTKKWEKRKDNELENGIHAIRCANWLATNQSLKVVPAYFFSDSQDLVQGILQEYNHFIHQINNNTTSDNFPMKIVARSNVTISHLQRYNQSVEAYMSTFVDLYLASKARCITMGVGKFSFLAAKISGTNCLLRHEDHDYYTSKAWGYTMVVNLVPSCPI